MKRRSPLAASRRYYPGFFGALFLVVLRTAIGWHFMYEGTQKILTTPEGKNSVLARIFPVPEGPPFSSEGYLRNATGPLAPKFRGMIPDVDSLRKLDPKALEDDWSLLTARVADHYRFDEAQRAEATRALQDRIKVADDWFQVVENREKVKKYKDDLAEIEKVENNPRALESEKLNAWKERKAVDTDRRALVKEMDTWTDTLRDSLVKLAKPEQVEAAGPYAVPPTEIEKIDRLTMYGLTAVGLCLMLGLFTPLAALGGAAYLLSFYLSMPPWPGLPEGPNLEGHYRYVNKNLIEMFACLALASTPNGLWIGIDALLFGWIGRGRRAREQAELQALLESQGRAQAAPINVVTSAPRKNKSR
ncbi:DoxX family protein [Tundrisphaera sp. TA3]|uniref:DoxX family protein n=1 Tax=Tundrisphaera sp. TA3 TaxID=3435775 RepID=UPI003EBACE50